MDDLIISIDHDDDIIATRSKDSVIINRENRTIKFFEHWIEFMASGSAANQADDGYYIRMAYPDEYKTSQTKIIKFDKDYNSELEYTFYGLFPKALSDISVSYEQSDILKASCTFSFDRYVCGKNSSFSVYRGDAHNKLLGGLLPNINAVGGLIGRFL